MARGHLSMDNDNPASRAPTPMVSQAPTRATHSTTQATKAIPPALKGDCTYKVHSAEEGEKYLHSKLLSLANHPFTLEHISSTLFHISQIEGIPLLVVEAVHTIAFIVDKECVSHTAKVLIEHIKDMVASKVVAAISLHLGELLIASECISEASDKIFTPNSTPTAAPKITKSYANTIKMSPTTTTLACVVVKEHQVLLDPQEGHSLCLDNTPSIEISNKLAEIIDNIRDDDTPSVQIKAITKLRNRGLIVEMDNTESAKWIKSDNIANQFLTALDIPTCFKQQLYPILVPFLPISLDIDDPEWIHTVEVENNLERGDIEGARWIKQKERCSSHQRVAHAIFTLANTDIANTLLRDRLYVQKEKLHPKKDKCEPI